MASKRIPIIIGKLSTAIKILLLFALDAMADNSVRDVAKPRHVNAAPKAKIGTSAIGLVKKTMNKPYPAAPSNRHRRKL